jgi:hypothetical protein
MSSVCTCLDICSKLINLVSLAQTHYLLEHSSLSSDPQILKHQEKLIAL